MAAYRWLDRTQPQTLVMGTIVLYINAAFQILAGGIPIGLSLVLMVADVGGAFGIANEKKIGYWIAVVAAVASLALTVRYFSFGSALNLIFWGAVVGLLLHPDSRGYRRIWFK